MQLATGSCGYLLLDPQLYLKRWYGHGSISPSIPSVLQKLSMVLRAHVELCLGANWIFLEKIMYGKKWSKWLRKRSFQLFDLISVFAKDVLK